MNKGTSQESRTNKALGEDYISIDERSMLDMVKFTLDFSQNVNFYGLENRVIDNWKSFLLNDSAFIIATIATTDVSIFRINIDDVEYQSDQTTEFEMIQQSIDEMLEIIKRTV
jgi:hypothetical protein